MPRSRNAAPVIRRGSPNRPAQPLIHRDSPSVGMGSKGVPRRDPSSSVAGVLAPPTRSVTVGPCLPWVTQEADVGHLLQAMGEWTGTKPAGKHVSYRNGDLELACASGLSARHLRRPSPGSGIHCAADARHMQTPAARAGQVASVRRRPQTSVTVRHRPSGSRNMTEVTSRRAADPIPMPTASRPGEQRLATRVVIPRPHPGSRGTSKAESQAGATGAAARGASAIARPSAGGFQDDCRPGAGADRAQPGCTTEGRNGTRQAG
jgi:hypothetical protein